MANFGTRLRELFCERDDLLNGARMKQTGDVTAFKNSFHPAVTEISLRFRLAGHVGSPRLRLHQKKDPRAKAGGCFGYIVRCAVMYGKPLH